MGLLPPMPPMIMKGMSCPRCGSVKVDRVFDFWSIFDIADRRKCEECGFRSRYPNHFYRGPYGCLWVSRDLK